MDAGMFSVHRRAAAPRQMGFYVIAAAALALGAGLIPGHGALAAQEEQPPLGSKTGRVAWLTGPALQKKLQMPEPLSWEDNPLRPGLANLSREHRVALFIDRRVDPTRRVTLQVTAPFRGLLEEIARAHNEVHAAPSAFPRPAAAIGVAQVGNVFYIGPVSMAARLATITELRREEVRNLPLAARQVASRVHAWHWDDAAPPQELLQTLARDSGIAIFGDALPHDLWAANDLPQMGFPEKLSLLLANYDLTFRWAADGTSVRIDAIRPEDELLTRTYPAGAKPQDFANQVRKLLPNAKVELAGRNLTVTGRAEDHQMLEEARQAGRETAPAAGGPVRELFSLNATNAPLRAILNRLRDQQKLEIQVDEESLAAKGLSLDTKVTVNVKQVSLDVLLRQACSQAKLGYRLEGKLLEIFPAEK